MYRDDSNYPDKYETDILGGKIVGRMTGCFCPPHKGHFLTWETACNDLNLDVLFISSSNDKNKYKSRHGIPIKFTEWVISNWAAHITNADGNKVEVLFRADTPLPKIATNEFKQLYLIHIGEGDATTKAENEREKELWLADLKTKRNSDSDDPDISWGRKNKIVQTQLNEKGEYPPIYKIANKTYWRDTTNPDAKSPSATKFTKCLKAYKINPSESNQNACYDYLPDFLTVEEKNEYIEKIMTEYYTDDSYAECLKILSDDEERCNKFNFSGESSAKRTRVDGGKKRRKTIKKRKSRTTKKRKRRSMRKTKTMRKKYIEQPLGKVAPNQP